MQGLRWRALCPLLLILHAGGEPMGEAITKTLAHSLERLDALLHRDVNTDMIRRLLRLFGRDAAVFFVDGMCSGEFLQRFVLDPARAVAEASTTRPLDQAVILALPVGDVAFVTDFDTLVQGIVNGKAAVLVEGMAGAVCVDIRFFLRRSISTPLNENVVMGPHGGLQ